MMARAFTITDRVAESTPATAVPCRSSGGSVTTCSGCRSLGLDPSLTPEFTNTPAEVSASAPRHRHKLTGPAPSNIRVECARPD
jgi:hypothetical protein